MSKNEQFDLLSEVTDLDLARQLLADLHNNLLERVARFHQLAELSRVLGSSGTWFSGEISYTAWIEARDCFVNGNYVATVLLCQSLAENLLAAHLSSGLGREDLPPRIEFRDTLRRCLERNILSKTVAADLERLMNLRNPLSHYRGLDDPSNLMNRAMNTGSSPETHLLGDATFAIRAAIGLLALPSFRLGV